MYQFDFRLDGLDESTITVLGETYAEAEEKIKELGIPKLKLSMLILVSVLETYDDAMYFEPDFDIENEDE